MAWLAQEGNGISPRSHYGPEISHSQGHWYRAGGKREAAQTRGKGQIRQDAGLYHLAGEPRKQLSLNHFPGTGGLHLGWRMTAGSGFLF